MISSLQIAKQKNLMQLTHWLDNTEAELLYLEKECERITRDRSREALVVQEGIHIALFVNRVA